MLGDGTVGLMAIKARKGVAIAQDPAEAPYPSMPLRAIEHVQVDHVLPARDIASLLVRLSSDQVAAEEPGQTTSISGVDTAAIQRDLAAQARGDRAGQVSVFSCPECGGALWQLDAQGVEQFRCHVGHTYAPEVLLVQKSEELEGALWAGVRALVERSLLARQLAARAHGRGDWQRATEHAARAEADARNIALIREQILNAPADPT